MTAPTAPLSFGVKTSQQGTGYAEILRVWREADQLPVLEHAWLWDHLVPLRGEITGAALEAWTLLAALAAQTARLQLGIMVTSNRLRRPALLAKMAATTDVISGGRLVFGLGAGGSRVAGPNPRSGSTPPTGSRWSARVKLSGIWLRRWSWPAGCGPRPNRSTSTARPSACGAAAASRSRSRCRRS
jgi:alkanesulfonate monooxygenase SsuD/methylene tetrahydromethanopterin reductase-like flavin-dependent oxidoreductase (luciferase family)